MPAAQARRALPIASEGIQGRCPHCLLLPQVPKLLTSHDRRPAHDPTSGASAEPPVSSVRHQLLKTRPAENQIGVVAALEVDIGLLRQAVVHNDIEPVRGAKRRHCTPLAIEKERLDLLLTGQVQVAAKQSPELFELD